MTQPPAYTFTRYLAAKQSVDDRALNAHVWSTLQRALKQRAAPAPLAILEIGAGIGTMVERLLATGSLPPAQYALLDAAPEHLTVAQARLTDWARQRGGQAAETTPASPFTLPPASTFNLVVPGAAPLALVTYPLDLFAFLDAAGPTPVVDLLIAHAFMDLVDVPATLARLRPILRPGALLYLTINFDGATLLLPEVDAALDAEIERRYHATMDNRRIAGRLSGDSRTGRRLFHHLRAAGIQVLDAGSSDWVVIPHNGSYPDDEAYFLHFIINTMEGALRSDPGLDSARFAAWIAERHAQVERGELVYIAHQLDYLARYDPVST
ncbi:MAG TPA: class I SAM-dependent methyltransferase [Caldilineaceae bacterium]|nr:class I SAM-dependent methyltransferase [Caldilineaceae bacterium]